MCRKGYILKSKKAFVLVATLFIIALLSGVAILTLNLQSNMVKKSTDLFLYTQAKLLLKSAADFAVLQIGGFDRSDGYCLENLNINANPFDINVTINYIFAAGNKPSKCNNCIETDIPQSQNGTAIIDVIVQTTNNINIEPIRIHNRSVRLP